MHQTEAWSCRPGPTMEFYPVRECIPIERMECAKGGTWTYQDLATVEMEFSGTFPVYQVCQHVCQPASLQRLLHFCGVSGCLKSCVAFTLELELNLELELP